MSTATSAAPTVQGYQMSSYTLSGCTLNRYETERQQKDNIHALLKERLSQQPRLVVLTPSANHMLVSTASDQPRWFFELQPPGDASEARSTALRVKDMAEVVFVGEFPDTHVNLFVTSSTNVASTLPPESDANAWQPTRPHAFIHALPRTEQAALGLCLSLQRWHTSHRFCSQCGCRTDPTVDLGFSRYCPQCHTQHFPRIMPAMIVAVFDGRGHVLLSRRSRKSPIYTVLSGFSILGESFEETVVREVREETGAAVTLVRYIGSQPWPYPYLVMLVYYAVAPQSPDLVLEASELVDVRWISKESVRRALDGCNPDLQLHGPGTTPYAMLKPWVDGLVDDWGRPTEKGLKASASSHL